MSNSDLVDIEAEIRQDKPDYWMVWTGHHQDNGREEWISLSKEYVEHDGDGTFTMPEWYAIRKELV